MRSPRPSCFLVTWGNEVAVRKKEAFESPKTPMTNMLLVMFFNYGSSAWITNSVESVTGKRQEALFMSMEPISVIDAGRLTPKDRLELAT